MEGKIFSLISERILVITSVSATGFLESPMAHASHVSTVVTPILLSMSLFSCRDEHVASHVAESLELQGVPIVRSLERLAERPEGTRVYLTNVSLVALSLARTNAEPAHFIVVDGYGNKEAVVLSAARSSMLWELVPERGERSYQDFGATVEQNGNIRVLSLFKLGN